MLYLANLAGGLSLAIFTVAMLLVVPAERIRRLALFGILFGGLLGLTVIFTMQNLLGFWAFREVDPGTLTVAGIPILLALAWTPMVVIFAHLLVQYRTPELRLLLWLGFAGMVTGAQYLMIVNTMLVYRNWTLPGTFLFTLAIHAGLMVVLHIMGHLDLRGLFKSGLR